MPKFKGKMENNMEYSDMKVFKCIMHKSPEFAIAVIRHTGRVSYKEAVRFYLENSRFRVGKDFDCDVETNNA